MLAIVDSREHAGPLSARSSERTLDMAHLMTPEQLAELLGCSVGTLYNRRSRGLPMPPTIKVPNGAIRWRVEDVDAWLDERVERSAS
jgi:predicted DNA-binding transcriptional regulator AlpA